MQRTELQTEAQESRKLSTEQNPFELTTASKLSAQEAVHLWCDDKRLDRVRGKESCFVNGNRGTGKSMLFRILQHDCQEILRADAQSGPEFLSVYVSVRDSELLAEEVNIFQTSPQRNVLCESQLLTIVLKQFFRTLSQHSDLVPDSRRKEFLFLLESSIKDAFLFSEEEPPNFRQDSFADAMESAFSFFHTEGIRIATYIATQLYRPDIQFKGPLFLFESVFAPIADYFASQLELVIYVLVDDGDDLPLGHTTVLNTWIARRRKSVVFKVSTMYGYKTFETRTGSVIQHPHDFLEYDVATRYLANKSEDYVKLVREICLRRLDRIDVDDVYSFFPEDEEQNRNMQALSDELRKTYEGLYEGRRVRDLVYRHLFSEYMKQLNEKRATNSFSYSGFNMLAILSGGLVRDFISCAQLMYDYAARAKAKVCSIPPEIQNQAVRTHADHILDEIGDSSKKRIRQDIDWPAIRRLVEGLGALFKKKMLSDDSERRVFSFALQSEPGKELARQLEVAVGEGYLMKGFISRKEGTGRRPLYVLTRRLAPAFSLDVSSYSGYLSLLPEAVMELAENGVRSRLLGELEDSQSAAQVSLFENGEEWIVVQS